MSIVEQCAKTVEGIDSSVCSVDAGYSENEEECAPLPRQVRESTIFEPRFNMCR